MPSWRQKQNPVFNTVLKFHNKHADQREKQFTTIKISIRYAFLRYKQIWHLSDETFRQ